MASTFKNSILSNIGSTADTVYTAPTATATTVIGLSLSNITSNLVLVTVKLVKDSANSHIVKDVPVPSGSTLVLFGGDQKLVMMAGNSITVASDTVTSIDAILSYMELS